MSQGPESQAAPAPPADQVSPPETPAPTQGRAASVFSNAILMIVGGGIAAGGYALARLYAPPGPPGELTGPANAGVDPGEFKSLAGRVDALKGQVEGNSKKIAEASSPDVDLRKLRDQVDDLSRAVGDLPARFNMVDKKIDAESKSLAVAPSPRLDSIEKRMVDLSQTVDILKDDVKARATISPPAANPRFKAIERDVTLFKEGKYAEADAAFARLQATSADDARVWYYSALAHGLATNDWRGETERLVLSGIEREKVGSPSRAEIDTAFAGLTPSTGKDWLAAYRKRAVAP